MRCPTPLIFLLFFSFPGCQQGTSPNDGPLQIKLLPSQTPDKHPKPGAAFARLSGGGIQRPVTIPLWMRFDAQDDPFKCSLDHQLQAIRLTQQKVYIRQANVRCGNGPACRILDLKTRRFTKPKHCIQSPTGGRLTIQRLDKGLFFLYGYHEGPGVGQIVSWHPDKGQTIRLAHITSPQPLRRVGTAFILHSACNPYTGHVPHKTWNTRTCTCRKGQCCGYCAAMYGKTLRWTWNPNHPTHIQQNPSTPK